mmetsp:Transcript_14047/g.18756  ORF Transcript_14047/g.18756 Transcript_14047/m.18756 type:complete len:87 (+) Transcript_14047:857-1117(+)
MSITVAATLPMTMAEKANGNIPPMIRKVKNKGSRVLTPEIYIMLESRTRDKKAPRRATETSDADPMACPFPMAAKETPEKLSTLVF